MRASVLMSMAGVLAGIALGVGAYTFIYARGYSYFSNNPAACTNCHVMRGYYDGWVKSSHRLAASCNDCHTPANPVRKYAVKASNGFLHSWAFTRGGYPDSLQIRARNHNVTEAACRTCHQTMVRELDAAHRGAASTPCLHCHAAVGHAQAVATSTSAPFLGERP